MMPSPTGLKLNRYSARVRTAGPRRTVGITSGVSEETAADGTVGSARRLVLPEPPLRSHRGSGDNSVNDYAPAF
jgi:hypothetical protein